MSKIVVVTATGVAQPKRASNAMFTLHEKLDKLPSVHAIHTTYRDSAIQLASHIAHELDPKQIWLTGHSAGGKFVNDVATNLDDFSFMVEGLVLADAWIREGLIYVRGNVRNLWSYRQNHNFGPRGSEIELEDANQTKFVVNEEGVAVRHASMDEYVCDKGVVYNAVIQAAGGTA